MARPSCPTHKQSVGRLLFLVFTIVPFIELYLLLVIGGEVGFWPTVAGVLTMGAIGAFLAKTQGAGVIKRWRESLAAGRVPEDGILDGILIVAGGALLVAPGVITDVVGLALLIPPTRRLIAKALRKWLEKKVEQGNVRVTTFGFPFSGPFGGASPFESRGRSGVIDVEGEVVDRDRPRLTK